MASNPFQFQGLNDGEVVAARAAHGSNALKFKKESSFLKSLKAVVREPMVLLLFLASTIYFISGEVGDGIFLAAAIVLVAGISIFQDARSRNALDQLRQFTRPSCKAIRGNEVVEISSDDLVVGDFLVVEEGSPVAADGRIVHANDFTLDEAILTGESMAVAKNPDSDDPFVYLGTTAVSGMAIAQVTATGNATRLGRIGKSLEDIAEEKTPLERQIGNFVKWMVVIGAVVFALVWGINYLNTSDALHSLLMALTLAMSILPEEIPVAFATFMALGAWRLMKTGVVVKQMKTVESLGSATVICTDKTGTLTKNEMTLARCYVAPSGSRGSGGGLGSLTAKTDVAALPLIRMAMWASEPMPFDPMEKALHSAYADLAPADERPLFKMVHEYPIGGKPPMMTHVFENAAGQRIIAAKGAPEALMALSSLPENEAAHVRTALEAMASEGLRVLGVGTAVHAGGTYPKTQQEFHFEFLGLVAFHDPPKENIADVLNGFYEAGIAVKIITGDNAITTAAIAQQVGFQGHDMHITGAELMALSDADLQEVVGEKRIFTRMFPEAKLRIINALKARGEVVAMTGDGVNDGPALKAAHIGIAMGRRGSELAKQAASLILVDDDLSKMVEAVAMGRKIYDNLKKAIGYIISIHIPIILVVFIPLALGWVYPNIFSPVHVIFLELIMGPTCSIIYENEPMEKGTMLRPPRPLTNTFFNLRELTASVVQGLAIAIAALGIYLYAAHGELGESTTRTMVFTVLIAANIVLTLVNRSLVYSLITTLRYRNRLVPIIVAITIALTAALIYVPTFADFFGFEALGAAHLAIATAAGFVSALWWEGVKAWRRWKLVNS